MFLLSFVGTGNYEQTTYLRDGKTACERYVQAALHQFLNPDEPMRLMVTPEAHAKHWQALRARLLELGAPEPVQVDISHPKDTPGFWDLFQRLADAVPPDARVHLDITHSFRSQPLLALLASAYLTETKKVEVHGIHYGQFEPGQAETPVADLSSALALLEWIIAARAFRTAGNPELLAAPLQTLVRPGVAHDQTAQRLNRGGQLLKKLGQQLETLRVTQIGQTAAQLGGLDLQTILREASPLLAPPLQLLVQPLAALTQNLSRGGGTSRERLLAQYELVLHSIRHERTASALILAREWIVSAVAFLAGHSDFDTNRNTRATWERALASHAAHRAGELGEIDGAVRLPDGITGEITRLANNLADARNDIAHAGMREHPRGSDTLKQALDDFENLLAPLLARIRERADSLA